MKKLFLFLGLGGVAYGIYNYYEKQVQLLNYLSYKIVGIKLLKSNLQNINLEVLLEITNNSEINLTITDYYFKVYVNDKEVGTIVNKTLNQKFDGFGANSNFPLKVQINNSVFFGETGILKGLMSTLQESELKLIGSYGVKKGLLKFSDIEIKESIKLKEYL
tara:strand:+ start:376 stop:861 length:486 start_codon:yes stop_codon:yes gene_type:complete